MKKNIVQDVIPPKKTIRNIELPSRQTAKRATPPKIEEEPIIEEAPKRGAIKINRIHEEPKPEPIKAPTYTYEYDEPVKKSRKGLYVSIGVLVLALAFGVSALFKSAEIRITPKQETLPVMETFVATKDLTTGGLGFQVVTISKDTEKIVEAGSEIMVEKKARGTIVVYNDYSTTAQQLVATTRFETPEGLIFRAVNPVSVPGRQTKDGKTVAGSAEVLVEADKAGVDYNVGLKDLTIVGFKGDPRYTKIYARSKTPMTGGFSGMQKVVSDSVLSETETELEASLRTSLSNDILSQIPANFVLYADTLSYTFEPAAQAEGSNGGAILKKRGTAHAVIFDSSALSRALLGEALPGAVNETVLVDNLPELVFSNKNLEVFNPNTTEELTFSLAGDAHFVWVFDENKLKADLLGLSKTSAKTVIGSYGVIEQASVLTRPFWNSTIPSDPEKVELINTLDE